MGTGSCHIKRKTFWHSSGTGIPVYDPAEVTPNRLKSFVVQDILEDCLTIEDASKVSIVNDAGQTVTDWFDVAVEGQKVTCRAKAESLQDEAFTDNQTYTFTLKVRQRPELRN